MLQTRDSARNAIATGYGPTDAMEAMRAGCSAGFHWHITELWGCWGTEYPGTKLFTGFDINLLSPCVSAIIQKRAMSEMAFFSMATPLPSAETFEWSVQGFLAYSAREILWTKSKIRKKRLELNHPLSWPQSATIFVQNDYCEKWPMTDGPKQMDLRGGDVLVF